MKESRSFVYWLPSVCQLGSRSYLRRPGGWQENVCTQTPFEESFGFFFIRRALFTLSVASPLAWLVRFGAEGRRSHSPGTQVNARASGGHAVGHRRPIGWVGGCANPARVTEMDQMKTHSRWWSDSNRLPAGWGEMFIYHQLQEYQVQLL